MRACGYMICGVVFARLTFAPMPTLARPSAEISPTATATVISDATHPNVGGLDCHLDRRLPEINFDGNSLSDVLDFFRDVSGAKIAVDWRALEAKGIVKDTPITLRLRDVKFTAALQSVLDAAGGENVNLGWHVSDGAMLITTAENIKP